MDSQEAKDSCFHFNAINECRTKIARIKQEKVPIKKSIQTLEDDIEEIDSFVFDYPGRIPEVVFQSIQSKEEDLRDERRELYEQFEELNEKVTELKEEIVEFKKYAKKAHCSCMRKKKAKKTIKKAKKEYYFTCAFCKKDVDDLEAHVNSRHESEFFKNDDDDANNHVDNVTYQEDDITISTN